jgi:hypothetical protein
MLNSGKKIRAWCDKKNKNYLKYCQDTINRQFNSTMENNFAGKTAFSLSYPGAGVR